MTDIEAVRRACDRLGYQVTTPEVDADGLAWPGVDAEPIPDHASARPLAVEFVDADPHGLLATVGESMRWQRGCLLVPRGAGAEAVAAVLRAPTGAREEDELGCRTFYSGLDRVHVDGGGLAAHYSEASGSPTFEWREEPAGEGTATDDTRLLCEADGEVIAVLDGVDGLCRPDRSAFAHHYRREDDRRFHVYDRDGRERGVFSGVAAMRDRGFHPVPAPVVPESVLPGSPGDAWAVLDAGDGRLLTASGVCDL